MVGLDALLPDERTTYREGGPQRTHVPGCTALVTAESQAPVSAVEELQSVEPGPSTAGVKSPFIR